MLEGVSKEQPKICYLFPLEMFMLGVESFFLSEKIVHLEME